MNKSDLKTYKTLRRLNKETDAFLNGKIRPKHGLLPKLAAAIIGFVIIFPPFVVPVAGRVSSNFFFRHDPLTDAPLAFQLHKGIDIAAASGTPVQATAIGMVSGTGYTEIAGNWVQIDHLFGFSSHYAHLSSLSVRRGSLVIPGLLRVGASGATGQVTGPHLHFELRWFGVRLPPEIFLSIDWLRRRAASIIMDLIAPGG